MEKIAVIAALVVLAAGGAYYFFVQSRSSAAPAGSLATAATEATSSTAAVSSNTISNQSSHPMSAILHTSMGDITIEFYPDQAPKTVENFVTLAKQGFYNGTKFHRVIKGFMDQGGDPFTKDDSKQAAWGTGGPGYTIPDEFGTTYTNTAGAVAMANTGQPNSSGSQFFINAVDNHFLDGKYSVFGHVTAGMSVVEAINSTPTDASDRPITPVVLNSVTIQ